MLATLARRALRTRDCPTRGFAVGVAAHGVGTARALQLSELARACSSLAAGLNGFATALLLPLLVRPPW